MAVELFEQADMLNCEPRDAALDRGADGARSNIPADPQPHQRGQLNHATPVHEALGISPEDFALLAFSAPYVPLNRRSHPIEREDVRAEHRAAAHFHVEAIVIGGVMAAGYVNALLHVLF